MVVDLKIDKNSSSASSGRGLCDSSCLTSVFPWLDTLELVLMVVICSLRIEESSGTVRMRGEDWEWRRGWWGERVVKRVLVVSDVRRTGRGARRTGVECIVACLDG